MKGKNFISGWEKAIIIYDSQNETKYFKRNIGVKYTKSNNIQLDDPQNGFFNLKPNRKNERF